MLCLYGGKRARATPPPQSRKKVLARDEPTNGTAEKIEFNNNHYFFGRINRNYTHVMYQIFIKVEWSRIKKASGMGDRLMYTF